MTKINILHVAINYIRALENLLDTGDAGFNSYGTAIIHSPFKQFDEQLQKHQLEEDQQGQEAATKPPVRIKVLRPLHNQQQQHPAAAVQRQQQSPRNDRGLKVLHPQESAPEDLEPGRPKESPSLFEEARPDFNFAKKELDSSSGSEDSGIMDDDEVSA